MSREIPWPNTPDPLGGVGGGTNPAGDEELDDVIDNLRKITRLQEPGYGLLAGEIAAAAIAADMLRDLRAVVEGLRTQLATESALHQTALRAAIRESNRADALQVRVDAVKALADTIEAEIAQFHIPGATTVVTRIRAALAGSVGVSDD